MTENIYITAVSDTAVWAGTGLTADGVRFESSTAHAGTQIVKLSGPFTSAPAQRQLLAGGPWKEMAVHSESENADVWIESRIAVASEDRNLHEGQAVLSFVGHTFDTPATMTEARHLLPGDVYWSTVHGLVTVRATSRLGQITKIVGCCDTDRERLDSDTVVPLCDRSVGVSLVERDVPDYGGGFWRETTAAD